MVVGLYLFLAQHYKSLNDINFQVSLWVTTNQQVRTNFSVPHPSQLLYQHCHVHKLQSFIVSLSTLHLGEWQEGGFKNCVLVFSSFLFSRVCTCWCWHLYLCSQHPPVAASRRGGTMGRGKWFTRDTAITISSPLKVTTSQYQLVQHILRISIIPWII